MRMTRLSLAHTEPHISDDHMAVFLNYFRNTFYGACAPDNQQGVSDKSRKEDNRNYMKQIKSKIKRPWEEHKTDKLLITQCACVLVPGLAYAVILVCTSILITNNA